MAGVTNYQADIVNGRVWAMWEADGFQHRINILMHEGAEIPMHSHSYSHDYRLGVGVYALTVEVDGVKEPERLIDGGSIGHVPAGVQHHFRLVKWGGAPGHVDCYWRVE